MFQVAETQLYFLNLFKYFYFKYPMIPADQVPPHAHQPLPTTPQPPYSPNNNPEQQQPPGYNSPYRDLIHDAHHTAYVSNTPHGMYSSHTFFFLMRTSSVQKLPHSLQRFFYNDFSLKFI